VCGEKVTRSLLELFDRRGKRTYGGAVDLEDGYGSLELNRALRGAIQTQQVEFAVLSRGVEVEAIYVASKALPEGNVQTHFRVQRQGHWLVRAMRIGSYGGGRILAGDGIVIRQVDVTRRESWLLPYLVRMKHQTDMVELVFGLDKVVRWEESGQRYYLLGDGPRWGVFGAGSTVPAVLDQLERSAEPADGLGFLWSVGAVCLNQAGRIRITSVLP